MSATTRALSSMALLGVLLTGCEGCIVVTGWGSPAHWVEAAEEFSIPCHEIDELRAKTRNGFIQIEGTDAEVDEILVTATIKAGGRSPRDADECLEAIVIDASRTGSTQKLTWRWDPDKRRGWSATVNFRVSVPRSIAITSESHNGAVTVARIAGPVTATTHNGKVVLQDVTGEIRGETHNGPMNVRASTDRIRLVTHNGKIQAELERFGSLSGRIETHNGGIEVGLAGFPSTEVRCRTGNGAIRCSGLELHSVHRTRRSLSGRVGEGDGTLHVETHNGSIKLRDGGIDRSF